MIRLMQILLLALLLLADAGSQVFQPAVAFAASLASASHASPSAILQALAYQDLMSAQSTREERHALGAFFLLPPFEDAADLSKKFTNAVPRVDLGTNNLAVVNGRHMDKATQRPAVILWAKTPAVSNNVAEVSAGWSIGPEAGQFIRYTFAFTNGNWAIMSRKLTKVF